MTDLSLTIAPKSDQLNADDLIAGPLTVKVTKVSANEGSAEQPISIYFEGDGDKPYKPCKTMRRVLVQVWGKDGATYPGRSLTLYRDSKVLYGGLAVGGIRISHMSHIDAEVTLVLTETRAKRKPYVVKPLVVQKEPVQRPKANGNGNGKMPDRDVVVATVNNMIASLEECETEATFRAALLDQDTVNRRAWLLAHMQDESERLEAAILRIEGKLAAPFPVADDDMDNAAENVAA